MFVLRLLAYFPFYYNEKLYQYRTNRVLLAYPIVFVTTLCVILNWIYITEFQQLTVKIHTDTASVPFMLFSGTCLFLFTFNHCSQYFHFSTVFDVAKQAKKAMQFSQITLDIVDYKSLRKFWFKCIMLPIFCICVNNLRVLRISKTATGKYFKWCIFGLGLFVQEIITNLHYALLLCTSLTFATVNAKLKRIMDEAQRLNDQQHLDKSETPNRMQLFCDLSDRLDRVAEMHYRWSLVAERLQAMFSGSVTIWMVYKQVALMTYLFLMFILASEWLRMQKAHEANEYLVDIIWYGFLLAAQICFELFLLAKECTRATNEVTHILIRLIFFFDIIIITFYIVNSKYCYV